MGLLAFVYRFNALSGAGGGFDDQHFLYLVHAREILAGGQPLRDFLDAGLQGARPSLAYELPALAQRMLGPNLRSEAVLTVGGVALGAMATAAAASRLVQWPWAVVATLLSILVSPKLYSYPKVLALGVMTWLVVEYARRPSRRRLAAMAAWTAVAFLFRHDLAVYCGVAALIVLALAGGRGRAAVVRPLAYAAMTAVLLVPSLWWVERYAGIAQYVRTGLAMSSRESERTDIAWPVPSFDGVTSVAGAFAAEANTEAWLYYLFLGIPVVAIAGVAIRWRRHRAEAADAALLALSAMTLCLGATYLRGSLEARFGDMVPPVAVLGGVLLARGWGAGAPLSRGRVAVAAVTLLILLVTAASIWTLQSVGTELATTGLGASPAALVRRTLRVSSDLARLPEAEWAERGDGETPTAAQYLNRCTRPNDRVLMLTFAPDVLAFAERRFAGGRWSFIPGFYTDERYSTFSVTRLDAEPVPIALAEPEGYYAGFPGLAVYIRDRFVDAGVVTVGGRPLRILAHRNRPWHPYGPGAWPCFT